MLTAAAIDHILDRLPSASVGLVGDLFLDRYLDIDTALDEPSVETGLTAFQVTRVRNYPGALGTVLNNLCALGVGRVVPVAFVGDDGEGDDLRRCLAGLPGVGREAIAVTAAMHTPTYTKPMMTDGRAVREWNRFDIKNRAATPAALEAELSAAVEQHWDAFGAVLVLDQVGERGCGVVTAAVREKVRGLARTPEKFVMADSRERIGEFAGVAVKPNEGECERAGGIAALAERCGRAVFCTEGERGIRVRSGGATELVRGYPVAGPIDICGAGDSCSAGIACAKLAGCSDADAAAFGNLVASITVQQLGTTGTATPAQVRARWAEVSR